MRKRLEILFVLMLFSATAMLAQMTTSGINGMVTAGGDKAIGASGRNSSARAVGNHL